MILPLSEDFITNYDEDNIGPITVRHNPTEHKYFNTLIGPSFYRVTKANILWLENSLPGNVTFSKREFSKDGKRKLSMFVPDSSSMKFGDLVPDYVIFFDEYYIEKRFKEEMATIGGTTKTGFPFKIGVNYLIWDNVNMDAMAYGHIEKNLNLLALPQEVTFARIFNDIAEAIILHSSFKLRLY